MKVRWEPARIRQTNWKEYAVRFAFGGAVTALAGFIAHQCGPVIGGLFLAFPAILPATVTLVERDEGQRAAGADAAGATLGSVGLLGFAGIVWGLGPRQPAWLVLLEAAAAWFTLAAGLWWARERIRRKRHSSHLSSKRWTP
jgi:hypothetical protein